MIKIIKFIFYSFIFLFCFISANAINYYKYPEKNLQPGVCKKIFDEINFSTPNYEKEDPTIVHVDLYVDRIFDIDAKNLTFEAQVNLWLTWKEDRLIPILKKNNLFTETGKPNYLCTYEPDDKFISKFFDPSIEFFNRKDKPPIENYASDWFDIFSDGTVDSRLKDVGIFHSNFDFKKFPFDKQKLWIELWSEYPATLIRFKANEPAMSQYVETGIAPTVGDSFKRQPIDGWAINKINYYTYSYVDPTDGYPYEGFYFTIDISRATIFYIFKIILPIIFILSISWSVFWIRGSQLEAKVNITIVCLLSLIAYNFIMDDDIPKLSYLTFMDTFILISYFYTGVATILCVYSYLKKLQTGKDISVVDRYARFVGPISYFSILMVSLIYYYNLEGVGAFFRTFLLGPNI